MDFATTTQEARRPPADRLATWRERFGSEPLIYLAIAALLLVDAWLMLGSVATKTPRDVAFLDADRVTVVVATIAIVLLGAFVRADARIGAGRAFAIGIACGALFFARTLGLALADPTHIAWLLQGDWAQHYSGWAMFRDAPWHLPPGRMSEVWYPVGTSIVYTDSLPLLAIALKPFSPWLPHPFQYIGLWFALSAMLLGGFGALLATRIDRRPSIALIGAALFVFAPVFVNRLSHDTLTAQWLVVAALWLYFRPAASLTPLQRAWPWWLLAGVASLVHPYLAAMVLAIGAANAWRLASIDRLATRRAAVAELACAIVATLCGWWLAGASIIPRGDASGHVAYGKYSFNLLGFVNPLSFSRWLPSLPVLEGQYEGFAYAGLGVLTLGAGLLVDAALRRRDPHIPSAWRPLVVVTLLAILFAASTVLAIGTFVLVSLPIKDAVLGAFRSSGRFIWIASYVLLFALMWTALRRYRAPFGVALLGLALALQMADVFPAHRGVAQLRASGTDVPHLDDPAWQTLAAGRHHLTMLPPLSCGEPAGPYLPFLLFAAEHRLTFNTGYLARWDLNATNRYCAELQQQLSSGAWSGDDLYVVGAAWKDRFDRQVPAPHCETLNRYDVCVVEAPPSP